MAGTTGGCPSTTTLRPRWLWAWTCSSTTLWARMSPLTTPPVACLSRPSLAAPFPPTKLVSQRQRLSLLFGGQNWLNSLIHYSRYALGWFEEKDDMHQDDLKIRDEFMLFFKIASAARNWIHFVPQTAVTTFAFSSVFILLLWGIVKRDIRNFCQRGPQQNAPSGYSYQKILRKT